MSTPINPAGASNDPRLGTEQAASKGARRHAEEEPATRGSDAAEVTISRQAANAGEQTERVDSVGSIEDIDSASALAKTLAAQIKEQPAAARDAQAHSDPKAALNLLI